MRPQPCRSDIPEAWESLEGGHRTSSTTEGVSTRSQVAVTIGARAQLSGGCAQGGKRRLIATKDNGAATRFVLATTNYVVSDLAASTVGGSRGGVGQHTWESDRGLGARDRKLESIVALSRSRGRSLKAQFFGHLGDLPEVRGKRCESTPIGFSDLDGPTSKGGTSTSWPVRHARQAGPRLSAISVDVRIVVGDRRV